MTIQGDFHFVGFGIVHPKVTEAVAFIANENSSGGGHVDVPVHLIGVRGGGDDVDIVGIEEVEDFCIGGDGYRKIKDHAARGADYVGVEDIDKGFADYEGIDARGFGRADHVTEVAGFFNGFDDEEEGVGGEGEISEALRPRFGNTK